MVERLSRRGPNPGTRFWGCSSYPDCRGTRPLDPSLPAAETSVRSDVAGRSARSMFEVRRTRHRAKARERRSELLLLGVMIIIAGVVIGTSGDRIGPNWTFFGWMFAVFGGAWTVAELIGLPDEILSWRRGAAGEEETGRLLGTLPPEFRVLHDRRVPNSRANIDHIVVGPTGIFAIETKSYAGRMTIREGELFVAGRRRTPILAQAHWEADMVRSVVRRAGIQSDVAAIICVHRAELPRNAPTVDGVTIVDGVGMIKRLTNSETTLAESDVDQVWATLDRALRPA